MHQWGIQMNETEKVNLLNKNIIDRDQANGYLIPRKGCSSYNYLSYLHMIDISLRRIADALEDQLDRN